ncbi:hypothetical protein NLG97_g10099 [Lecanicillium saksenae]|uniref:Uncharacterized protein n=1 Tax=Lecanicillium saksenae TaxID=468837 RepID=A0ACC1QFN1_9HYPO|nr:hypothetical protein NLG97_g10099 [Lecanicillium saksenae]
MDSPKPYNSGALAIQGRPRAWWWSWWWAGGAGNSGGGGGDTERLKAARVGTVVDEQVADFDAALFAAAAGMCDNVKVAHGGVVIDKRFERASEHGFDRRLLFDYGTMNGGLRRILMLA